MNEKLEKYVENFLLDKFYVLTIQFVRFEPNIELGFALFLPVYCFCYCSAVRSVIPMCPI